MNGYNIEVQARHRFFVCIRIPKQIHPCSITKCAKLPDRVVYHLDSPA